MLECCRQDMKEAMICINNKYGLIKLRDLYQINHHLHLYTKTSCVIDSILNWEAVQLPLLHTLMQDTVSSF